MMISDSFAAIDCEATFNELFDDARLLEVFEGKFLYSSTKGTDRVNGFQFAYRKNSELAIAATKCVNGNYRFAPYLESLRLKGRGKYPRLISIPTVRDRVVLHQLKETLAQFFPECVPRNIASTYVRSIAQQVLTRDPDTTYVCVCDIKDFYGNLDRTRLMSIIRSRITYEPVLILIRRALATPTVPSNAPRRDRRGFADDVGIPQGLAISNLLASIYLLDVDEAMHGLGVEYSRYVDDILIFGEEQLTIKAYRSLKARLRARNLNLHLPGSGKSHIAALRKTFAYLGYEFRWPQVTVRQATVERLLQSIAAKFSEYVHNKNRKLERFKYLTEDRLKEVFLLELNERISGAINQKKRYGWVAYYSQINDLSLLHRLDSVVAGMFERLADFGRKPPDGLKKFRRAYFEMKFNPSGRYVRNYDLIESRAEKLAFLDERGRLGTDEQLTDEQINEKFESYKQHSLARMQADEGVSY